NHLLPAGKAHGNTAVVVAEHEIGSSVYGINIKGIFARSRSAFIFFCVFLAEKLRFRQDLFQPADQEFLDFRVEICDKIGGAFFLVNGILRRGCLAQLLSRLPDQGCDGVFLFRSERGVLPGIRGSCGLRGCLRFVLLWHSAFRLSGRRRFIWGRSRSGLRLSGQRRPVSFRRFPDFRIPAAYPAHIFLRALPAAVKSPVNETSQKTSQRVKKQIRKLEGPDLQKKLTQLDQQGKSKADGNAAHQSRLKRFLFIVLLFFPHPEIKQDKRNKKDQIFNIFCVDTSVRFMKTPYSQHVFQRVSPDRSAEQRAEQHHTYVKSKEKLSAEQRICTEFPDPSLNHRSDAVFSHPQVHTHKQNSDHK